MTLVLKTFKELKTDFESTLAIMGAIDTLSEPRKSELAFLQSIFELVQDNLITKGLIKKDDLSEIISNAPTNKSSSKPNKKQLEQQTAHDRTRKKLDYYSSVCYGATLFIIDDINNNLGRFEKLEGSTLYRRLRDSLGIKDNPLSLHQTTTSYKNFNNYLNYVFEGHDSRNGFKDAHILQFMELNKLVTWVQTSYALEKNAYRQELKAFAVEGETPVALTTFRLTKEMHKTLIEPYKSQAEAKDSCTEVSWKEMEASLTKVINTELKTKHLSNLSELRVERRIPLQFLKTLADCLSSSKLKYEDRMAILVGSMFLMRGKIATEYKLPPLHKDIISSSYTGKPIIVHTELSKLLDVENISYQDTEVFLHAANQFIEFLTFENKENVLSFKTKHLFTEIKGFNLKETLELSKTMICDCRSASIQECLDTKAERNRKETPTSGWGIFGSKKKKEKETEDLDALFGENKTEDTTLAI